MEWRSLELSNGLEYLFLIFAGFEIQIWDEKRNFSHPTTYFTFTQGAILVRALVASSEVTLAHVKIRVWRVTCQAVRLTYIDGKQKDTIRVALTATARIIIEINWKATASELGKDNAVCRHLKAELWSEANSWQAMSWIMPEPEKASQILPVSENSQHFIFDINSFQRTRVTPPGRCKDLYTSTAFTKCNDVPFRVQMSTVKLR